MKEKLPKGWFISQHGAINLTKSSAERPVACADCDWKGTELTLGRQFHELHRLVERLYPGDPVPVGECPECGAFCYYDDVIIAYKKKPNVLEALAECAPKKKRRG